MPKHCRTTCNLAAKHCWAPWQALAKMNSDSSQLSSGLICPISFSSAEHWKHQLPGTPCRPGFHNLNAVRSKPRPGLDHSPVTASENGLAAPRTPRSRIMARHAETLNPSLLLSLLPRTPGVLNVARLV